MKQGTTTTFRFHFNIDLNLIESIDFFFNGNRENKDEKEEPILDLSYPDDGYERGGAVCIPLTQEQTILLPTTFYIEPQINFKNKSSIKAHTKKYIMEPTIYTNFIEGNVSSGEEEEIDIEFDVDDGLFMNFDYEPLENKPKINGNELVGDKTSHDLGVAGLADLDSKVDKTADKETVLLERTVKSEEIDTSFYYSFTVDSDGFPAGGSLLVYPQTMSGEQDPTNITGKIGTGERVDIYGAKGIKLFYAGSEGYTEIECTFYNEVVREKEFQTAILRKQDIFSPQNKLRADLVYDDNSNNKFLNALTVSGHGSFNNNNLSLTGNKIYNAVIRDDNISYNLEDYPGIQEGDIAYRSYSNNIQLWFQVMPPDDIVYWIPFSSYTKAEVDELVATKQNKLEDYKLINTITITEAVSSVLFNKDNRGNNFAIDEFLLVAKDVKGTNNSNFIAQGRKQDHHQATAWKNFITFANKVQASTARTFIVAVSKLNDLLTLTQASYSNGNERIGMQNYQDWSTNSLLTDEKIDEVQIHFSSTNVVTAGTFMLYGRKR